MGYKRARTALVGAFLIGSALPAAAAPIGHIAWTHEDNAFFTTAQVTEGADPSVIVGAGHRNAFYSSCVPGNPSPQINGFRDASAPPEAKLIALDTATGLPRWQSMLSDQTGPASQRTRFTFLWQSLLDDIDGDGKEDLLIVTGEYDASPSSTTPVVVNPRPKNGVTTLSLRDPATGSVRWERSWPVADGHYEMVEVTPVSLGSTRRAIVVSNMVNLVGGFTIDSTTRLVTFADGSMREVADLSSAAHSLSSASVATDPTGLTVVLSHVRLDDWNGVSHPVDFEAFTLHSQDEGTAIAHLWSQRGAGGLPTGRFPAFITDDSEPKLITAQGNDGRPGMLNGIAAYDLGTGQELWRAPVYVGQGLGPLTVADLNGDGVDDAVGGMMGDVAGVLTLPPAPEIVAVDGRTGEIMWRTVDAIGKFRALSLATADLDGDGKPQVMASLVQRDGTTCGSAQDERGAIGVYDGATGTQECRLPTDRPVWTLTTAEVPASTSRLLVAPALGGTVYGFQDGEPGCGLLAAAISPPTGEPAPGNTEVSFTPESATSSQYSDATFVEARLSDPNGDPIPNADLVFELAGEHTTRSFTATTDPDGIAAVSPTLTDEPGQYQLTVTYSGDGAHEPSEAVATFVIEKEDTDLELTVSGKGKNRTLRALLSDRDSRDGIAGATIDFYVDGAITGSAPTDENGVATLELPPRYRGGSHDFEARFDGDDYYLGS